MEGIHDLIRKTDKSINIEDGCPQVTMQHTDGRRERRTVILRNDPAAAFTGRMKKMYHT
jgi:hypothetical protein